MPRVKSTPVKSLPKVAETIKNVASKVGKKALGVGKDVLKNKIIEKAKEHTPAAIDKVLEKLKGSASKMVDKYANHNTYGGDMVGHIDKYSRQLARELKKKASEADV